MEGSDDHFALKWNNFQSNFATAFHNLLQAEDLVDVTIAAEGKFVQAHKIILSVCSSYFKDLFKVNPCKHPVVILKDVRHQELSDMLDFMYRGEVSVRQEDLPSFLKLAETLKVKGLASEKDNLFSQTQALHYRKPMANVKKKKVIEQVFESDEGVSEYSPGPSEPKRKRRRVPSPQFKTESVSDGAATFVALASPKREVEQVDDVEFLEEATGDPLEDYMSKNKHDVTSEFEESHLDITAEETQDEVEDMSGQLAGPSGVDDSTDQVPPDDDREYKFILSKNGKQLLLLEGFSYRKYMTSRGSTSSSYWTCTTRGCRAKGNLAPTGVFTLTKYDHTHGPDFKEMKKKVFVSQLREMALNTDLTHDRLLRTFGVNKEGDSDRKYRAMINYWRWHAKRKREREDNPSKDMPEKLDYSFVLIRNTEYLNFQNFFYRKYKTRRTDGCSYWKCRNALCPSRVKINRDRSLSILIFHHAHPEELEAPHADQDIRDQLREVVLTTDLDVNEILSLYGVEKNTDLGRYVSNLKSRKTKLDRSDGEDDESRGVVVKVPKDFLLLQEGNESEQQTVVALDSFFKVVDAEGNEKTIVVKQGEEFNDDEEEEFVVNEEDDEYKEELPTFYVSTEGDEHTFVVD